MSPSRDKNTKRNKNFSFTFFFLSFKLKKKVFPVYITEMLTMNEAWREGDENGGKKNKNVKNDL